MNLFRIRSRVCCRRHSRVLGLAAWVLWVAAIAVAPRPLWADESPLSFNRDIRPILSNKCFACHGFDAKTREADLRLDTREGATEDRGGVAAIVPFQHEASELWRRVSSADESEIMPPVDANKPLTDAEKEVLRRWIDEGAEYQKHWSFEPIERPTPPDAAAGTSAIDAFVNDLLRQTGLTPNREADRETLIRRVSFALTGLPPTIAEVDAFLADTAGGAYVRMVDRYLASPRYGEEMARHWLDVARYADTHGLHLDNERQMWAFRDWVVDAFNQNLPYDQFTVWQVAGDLLPNPTTPQLVATGFNRCNVTTSEGGAISDEFTYRYAVERTTAVGQAWLGLTVGCAVCHDHKYDPISTKEFYSLYAFFNSAADPAMDGNVSTTAPFIKLPTRRQRSAGAAARKVEDDSREWLAMLAEFADQDDPASGSTQAPPADVRIELFDEVLPFGATSTSSLRNDIDVVADPAIAPVSGRRAIRQAFASDQTDSITFKLTPVVVPESGVFEFWLHADPRDPPTEISFGVPKGRVVGKGATWKFNNGSLSRGDSSDDVIAPGVWTKLRVSADELGLVAGEPLSSIALAQTGGICLWDKIELVGKCQPAVDPLESFSAWRKSIGKDAPAELPNELKEIVKRGVEATLDDADREALHRFFVAFVARPKSADLAAARAAWQAARTARIIAEEASHGTFIYRDMDKPRDSFVMARGQYDAPGDQVEPAIPAVFPQIAKRDTSHRLTRLDLAEWLVARDNPLTARVAANRLWQQLFGVGLVKTSYDFGTQGEPPSHPELLDWLAAELRDSSWDVKRFVRMLVMSDAFRRDSSVAGSMLARDPENRLYARGPRFRLDAEQIRDNALFVSELIDLRVGGRGVNVYQPPNIWEPVGYSNSNTRFYLQDHGQNLYRRSLYVFLKRTAPPPFMSNFDGPNREQVCTQRERSNTPLQALQLMNDTQHFEAARALAERALAVAGGDVERIDWLYRAVLSRHADAEETRLVSAALEKQRNLFAADSAAADRAIRVGESAPKFVATPCETAAWTIVANLIMNLDETLCRN